MIIENFEEFVNNIKCFRCGSPNLKNFLVKNGIRYLHKYRTYENEKTIWVFIHTEKLDKLLEEWTNNNPNGGEVDG